MNLKDSVNAFKEDLKPILTAKIVELMNEKKELETFLEGFRSKVKSELLQQNSEDAELKYKMSCMYTVREEKRLAEIIVELDNIINARDMLTEKSKEDLDVVSAKEYPIEDFVSDTKKTGRLLVGKCPFHQEKIGSFTIYPNNTYYCFSCKRGGDSIDFIMQLEGLSFPEAVRRLT